MDTSKIVSDQFDINTIQLDQFSLLKPLYQDWNSKINVISRQNMDRFYTEHILHSLGIAKILSFKPGTEILDVGTGGGFPGIPLAILFPEVHFLLVDSIGKKIKVVNAIIENLGLENVTSSHSRAENIESSFDFIISRAVTQMNKFYYWVNQKVKIESVNDLNNGILYLKGGNLTEEMNKLGKQFREYSLNNYFSDPFFETKKVVYVPVLHEKI